MPSTKPKYTASTKDFNFFQLVFKTLLVAVITLLSRKKYLLKEVKSKHHFTGKCLEITENSNSIAIFIYFLHITKERKTVNRAIEKNDKNHLFLLSGNINFY